MRNERFMEEPVLKIGSEKANNKKQAPILQDYTGCIRHIVWLGHLSTVTDIIGFKGNAPSSNFHATSRS